MIKIDGHRLNSLEKRLFDEATRHIQNNHKISITELATRLSVSPSKFSKFVRKTGLETFKQYKQFIIEGNTENLLVKKALSVTPKSTEIERIKIYLEQFEYSLVNDFYLSIKDSNKLIIYGIGPSFLVAEYFAYRLRIVSTIFSIATSDETLLKSSANQDTKLLVLSATGLFKSFDDALKGLNYQEIIFLFEELRAFPTLKDYTIFYLTESSGNPSLQPFEKSRTLFYIFLEEVIQKFMMNKN